MEAEEGGRRRSRHVDFDTVTIVLALFAIRKSSFRGDRNSKSSFSFFLFLFLTVIITTSNILSC